MGNGQALAAGFYIVDAATCVPLAGPFRSREVALASGVVLPCCILEVVGDWQDWASFGTRVPFDNVQSLVLEDGRLVTAVRQDGVLVGFASPGTVSVAGGPVTEAVLPIVGEAGAGDEVITPIVVGNDHDAHPTIG